jgi:Ca-activated chloride channel family protein
MRGFRFSIPASRNGAILLFLPLLLTIAFSSPAAAQKKPTRAEKKEMKVAEANLPEKYKKWLEEVDGLITQEEKALFLELEKDYQRDAFIKQFWEVRDTYKSTSRNEFKDRWDSNVALARSMFPDLRDERARMLMLNGPPAGRLEARCSTVIWPVEVWFYAGSDRTRAEFILVFWRKWGAGPFRIWQPSDGLESLFTDTAASSREKSLSAIANGCMEGDRVAGAISWVLRQGQDYDLLQQKLLERPDAKNGEWISSFGSYSTEMPEGATPLPAKLDVDYPGRYQNRTVLQGLVSVPGSGAAPIQLADRRSYNLLLTGEVLQQGELFDRFRYKFDFPANPGEEGDSLPLVFQRHLRPGAYNLIVKVEDVNSGKIFREERTITVPATERVAPVSRPPESVDAETARILAEANAALSNGDTSLRILPPHGELQTGMLRFDTLATGAVDKVTFALDGKALLTKKSPPFSVELDLGSLPRPRVLTALAYDRAGAQVASDELLINANGNRFKVRLVEPRKGQTYTGSLLARADVEAPEGQTVERVEMYLNEALVATLYQAPYTQPIILPKGEEIAYVRAVAYLADGNSTESLVFVNAPDYLEQIDVDFVELYTTVIDRKGRPVEGLTQKDFAVTESGVKQEIARFEKVTDLPVHVTVALDVSASMEDSLDKARQAALQFLQQTIRPKDRAAIVTFNDHPNLAVKFTGDLTDLAGGLAGLKAERGTAFYDTVVFSLYYFNGIKGQRAMLLLSDGKDEGSRFTFDDALEYARRAGVAIYTIGLGEKIDKKKLERLAEETGGRSFFLKNVDELAGIYAAVEEELRSKYLIAYQSTNTTGENTFRTIDVKVAQPGTEAKTLRGYYP